MKFFSLLMVVFIACMLNGQFLRAQPQISIQVPSIQQEATSIWRTIHDIRFFEQQGYQVNLPQGALIDSLVHKAKQGAFGNQDFSSIYGLLEAGAYNATDYDAAVAKVVLIN